MSLNYNYGGCSKEGQEFLANYAEGRACFYVCTTLNAIGIDKVTEAKIAEIERRCCILGVGSEMSGKWGKVVGLVTNVAPITKSDFQNRIKKLGVRS